MFATIRVFLRDLRRLAWPYWQSEERWRSGALYLAIVAMTLAMVWLNVLFNEWRNLFYNSLQDKDLPAFWHQMIRFCYLAALFIGLGVYQTYLQQMLQIRWRRWLTERYLTRWMNSHAYYLIQIAGQRTDNPDQRIAEDIDRFISGTLGFTLGLLNAVVTLVSFTAILWTLSGSLTWHGVTVPGYMMWVAIVYAIAGTWLVQRIGRPLIGLNFQQQRFEATFRYSLVRLRENAEGVALYGGEAQEQRSFGIRFADVVANWWAIMRRQKRLNWFSYGYGQVAIIFPYLVAAPRYFSGAIQLGGMMQTASAFDQVQSSLSWFINVYSSLADWKATVDRLTSFEQSLVEFAKVNQGQIAHADAAAGKGMAIADLDLALPDGRALVNHLNLELPPGSRTLVTGPSGSGKSTLFRALGGLWPYGKGTITFPAGERALFLPQKPYLPIASLRAAVSYPDAPDIFGDDRIRALLTECGLSHLAGRLDEEAHWGQTLSPGEQQRLAVARALLIAPRWLFLDEATSALDDETEAKLYRLLVERLPGTAIVSIAHRKTLAAFHERNLSFKRAPDAAPDQPVVPVLAAAG